MVESNTCGDVMSLTRDPKVSFSLYPLHKTLTEYEI